MGQLVLQTLTLDQLGTMTLLEQLNALLLFPVIVVDNSALQDRILKRSLGRTLSSRTRIDFVDDFRPTVN